jgi:hypothetical protein
MSYIRDITGYQTSRDYDLLWEIVQTQSIVCVVDYSFSTDKSDGVRPSRDVCQSIVSFIDNKLDTVVIGARGICYIESDNKEFFVEQCKTLNVEWLVTFDNKNAVLKISGELLGVLKDILVNGEPFDAETQKLVNDVREIIKDELLSCDTCASSATCSMPWSRNCPDWKKGESNENQTK